MKFSKLLTTAMMSVALVASSSAFAAEETTWWSMNFDGLAIEEGGSLANTLNATYGTTQNGAWSTEEGDLSTLEGDKLKLNTQGTDLTWKPNGENNTSLITYVDADVTFVGSDTAPTISETDVHTAVYLKNIVDDITGDVTNSVLCAWAYCPSEIADNPEDGDKKAWISLSGVEIKEKDENDNPITYNLRIMLDGNQLSFYVNGTLLTAAKDAAKTKFTSAKEGAKGKVTSVSFRGTGAIDNFAASQEAKVDAGSASVSISALWNDEEIDTETYFWNYDEINGVVNPESIDLNSASSDLVNVLPCIYDGENLFEDAPLSAVGVSVNGAAETLIERSATGEWPADTMITFTTLDDDTYQTYIDHSSLTNGDEVEVVFYYGTHTATDPEQLKAPVVTATTTANSVTLTWTAVTNAAGYVVTFNNGTPETVTETTFTVSNLTASTDYSYSVVAKGDGVNYTDSAAASGTATTAAAEVTVVEPDPIKISAISGPVEGNVVVTVVPATEGGKIKAGVNYWAVVSATLGGDETAQDPVTVPEDTNSLQITVPATGDSLFIKVKADTATAK